MTMFHRMLRLPLTVPVVFSTHPHTEGECKAFSLPGIDLVAVKACGAVRASTSHHGCGTTFYYLHSPTRSVTRMASGDTVFGAGVTCLESLCIDFAAEGLAIGLATMVHAARYGEGAL